MSRYWIFTGLVLLFFSSVFLLAEILHPSLLENAYGLMSASGIGAALAGTGLLVADVVLPVPSSLIMIANGALFGVALGTTLSIIVRQWQIMQGLLHDD